MLARLRQVATNKNYFDVRKNLEKKKGCFVCYPRATPNRSQINFILLPGVGLQVDGQRIATP